MERLWSDKPSGDWRIKQVVEAIRKQDDQRCEAQPGHTAVWSWFGKPARHHCSMALGLRLRRCCPGLDTARRERLGGAITPTPLCLCCPNQTISCASTLHGPCSSLEFPASGSIKATSHTVSSSQWQTQYSGAASAAAAEPDGSQVAGYIHTKRGPRVRWQMVGGKGNNGMLTAHPPTTTSCWQQGRD